MAIELRVPSLGESVTQATVGTWLRKEGERVARDEPVVEVESEKATVAVPAPAAGVIVRVLKASGATVNVGDVIAELDEVAASASTPASAAPARAAAPAPAKAAPAAAQPPAPLPAMPTPGATPQGPVAVPQPTAGHLPVRAPPSVRRLMAEEGVDAGAVTGAVVRRADVERALARGPAPAAEAKPPSPAGERERLVPMTPLRKAVARRLLEAQQNAAILTTFNEIDMTRVMALREELGEGFQKRHGVKLGFMSFFVKAAVEALRAFPAVNGEIRGDAVLYKDHYDVGVAVGGGKGLVVPVLRDADALSFAEVEKGIAALAQKARENRILPDDLAGGTFTISNGGVYGSLLSTPILNPPQSGILGLHKVQRRPVAVGDAVVVRPMMYVALSYDHRLIDGREAVGFLIRVKECVEAPERLLLEA